MTGSVGKTEDKKRGRKAARDDSSWAWGMAEGRKKEWIREGNIKEEETWQYLKANRM